MQNELTLTHATSRYLPSKKSQNYYSLSQPKKPMKTQNKKHVGVYVDPNVKEQFAAICKENYSDCSKVLRQFIYQTIEEHQNAK